MEIPYSNQFLYLQIWLKYMSMQKRSPIYWLTIYNKLCSTETLIHDMTAFNIAVIPLLCCHLFVVTTHLIHICCVVYEIIKVNLVNSILV